MSYGKRGYCTYLSGPDAAVVSASEDQPSILTLVERWLERTPFLDIGTFSFWTHYQQAVGRMHQADEDAIRANELLVGEPRELALAELAAQRRHFSSLFNEAEYEDMRKRGDRRISQKALQAVRARPRGGGRRASAS